MAQDVGMVQSVIPTRFGWFFEGSIPTCACLHLENFFVTCSCFGDALVSVNLTTPNLIATSLQLINKLLLVRAFI